MKGRGSEDTTSVGRGAEGRVAEYLKKHGWKILAQNWRNRWCEIDLIVMKDRRVAFVEVKYRSSDLQGDGFDAVTENKLDRMSRVAEAWVLTNGWDDEYELLVASVTSDAIELREIY